MALLLLFFLCGCFLDFTTIPKGYTKVENGILLEFYFGDELCSNIEPFLKGEKSYVEGICTKGGGYFFDLRDLEGEYAVNVAGEYYTSANVAIKRAGNKIYFKGRQRYRLRRRKREAKKLLFNVEGRVDFIELISPSNVVERFCPEGNSEEKIFLPDDVGKYIVNVKRNGLTLNSFIINSTLSRGKLFLMKGGRFLESELSIIVDSPSQFVNVDLSLLFPNHLIAFFKENREWKITLCHPEDNKEVEGTFCKGDERLIHFEGFSYSTGENNNPKLRVKIGSLILEKYLKIGYEYLNFPLNNVLDFGMDLAIIKIVRFFNIGSPLILLGGKKIEYHIIDDHIQFEVLNPCRSSKQELQIYRDGFIYRISIPFNEKSVIYGIDLDSFVGKPIVALTSFYEAGLLIHRVCPNFPMNSISFLYLQGNKWVVIDHFTNFMDIGEAHFISPSILCSSNPNDIFTNVELFIGDELFNYTFSLSRLMYRSQNCHFDLDGSNEGVNCEGYDICPDCSSSLDGTINLKNLDDQYIVNHFERVGKLLKGLEEVAIYVSFSMDGESYIPLEDGYISYGIRRQIRRGDLMDKNEEEYSFNILRTELDRKVSRVDNLFELKMKVIFSYRFNKPIFKGSFDLIPKSKIRTMGPFFEFKETGPFTLRPIISSQTFNLKISFRESGDEDEFQNERSFYDNSILDKYGREDLIVKEDMSLLGGIGQTFHQRVEKNNEEGDFMKRSSLGSMVVSLLDLAGKIGPSWKEQSILRQCSNFTLLIFGVAGALNSFLGEDQNYTNDSSHWGESFGLKKINKMKCQYDYSNRWDMLVYLASDEYLLKEGVEEKLFPGSSIIVSHCAKIRSIRQLKSLDGEILYRSVELATIYGNKRYNIKRTNLIKSGWYRLILKIDKVGMASFDDGWSIATPIPFKIFRHSEGPLSRADLSTKRVNPGLLMCVPFKKGGNID